MDEQILEMLRKLEKASPMKCVVVDNTASELERVDKEMAEKGLRWACSSNAGLPPDKMRLTYLPHSSFRQPGDPPYEPKTPVDVRKWLDELDH